MISGVLNVTNRQYACLQLMLESIVLCWRVVYYGDGIHFILFLSNMQSVIFMRRTWNHIKEQCVFLEMEFTG